MTRTVQIINYNDTIQLLWGTAAIPQDIMKVNIVDIAEVAGLADPMVTLKDNTGAEEKIRLSWVTVPVVGTIAALYNFLQTILNTTSSTPAATGTFVNGDLVVGVLSINHGLNTLYPALYITDPAGAYVGGVTITVVDADNITVDFGGAIGAGTWTWWIM
jgi:hypothetical protein